MDVIQLALTWLDGQMFTACFDLAANLSSTKWAQVIASQRKYAQALAKRSHK